MGSKPIQKWWTLKTKSNSNILGGCRAYKSGLRIFVCAPEVPFFGILRWALLAKVPIFGYKTWHFGCPNENSETTFKSPKSLNDTLMLLTCGRNGSKVLEPTPSCSPKADQLKLDVFDRHRIFEGEVEQGGRFASCCVHKLVLHQSLPWAVLVSGPRYSEVFGPPPNVLSLSLVLDLKATNQPCTVVQSHCESLTLCSLMLGQPKVELVIVHLYIFFTQNEDTACWVVAAYTVNTLNHLRFQWTLTV